METRRFFRVCNPDTQQGLWYDFQGNFKGLIHCEFDFCTNSKLEMDFDPELVGWLSATNNFAELFKWFTVADILRLQEHGWFIYEYEVENYRHYERFNHPVIEQATSKLVRRHEIFPREKQVEMMHALWNHHEFPVAPDGFGEGWLREVEEIVGATNYPVEIYHDSMSMYFYFPGREKPTPLDEYYLTVFPNGN